MVRLGVVSFLNARPLVEGLAADGRVQLSYDVPAALPGRLDRDEVDVALIPTVDVLRSGGRYRVLSDGCIGCDGETMTVRVFSQVPPDRVRTLWTDVDSHTSVALARVLWRELYGRALELRALDVRKAGLTEHEAVLLIGDKVVDPGRGSFAYEVDLGGAWRQHTGLPFVFAMWAYRSPVAADPRVPTVAGVGRGTHTADTAGPHADGTAQEQWHKCTADTAVPDIPSPRGTAVSAVSFPRIPTADTAMAPADLNQWAVLLAQARDRGVARAAEIAERDGPTHGWPVAAARRYLTRCLKFKLDARSVQGVTLFARLCVHTDIVPRDAAVIWPESLLGQTAELTR